jgi:hypothetical protein
MTNTSNVIRLELPKTAAQADRLKKLVRRASLIDVEITLLPDHDRFREQRAWRLLFGLYQDCACVPWSKGFKKRPGVPFVGKMRPSRLPLFLREAMPLVADRRAEVHIEGDRLSPRLLDVMTA